MRFFAAALALAGCAPAVVWTGGDASRRVHAEVVQVRGKQRLFVDGAGGPEVDGIAGRGIVFSADGRHVAYAAKQDGRWWAFVDGAREGPWDGVAEPVFSASGAHHAYFAEANARWSVVVDGAKGPEYEAFQGSPAVSDDGHVAGIAVREGCAQLVVDVVAGPCHGSLSEPRLLPKGRGIAVARDGAVARLEPHGAAFADIDGLMVVGEHFGFAGKRADRWIPVIDGDERAAHDEVHALQLGTSGFAAWVAKDGGTFQIVTTASRSANYPSILGFSLARESDTWAAAVRDDFGAQIVSGTHVWGVFSDVQALVSSHDGRHFAAIVTRPDGARVWFDGREWPFSFVIPGTLVLSDDGAHFAAIVGDDGTKRLWITVDGLQSRPAPREDVFGDDRPLRPWVARVLAETLENKGT